MPPRNPELPEGTDHIINGAMDTGTGSAGGDATSGGFGDDFGGGGATTGIGGGGTGLGSAGGTGGASLGSTAGETTGAGGTGFVASGGGDDTGGTAGGGGGASTAPVKQQLRDGVQGLKSQAGDKIRNYAVDGKERASTALDDFADVVSQAAASIDERLGSEYGQYARRAAEAVSGYAETLRGKEVDELFDDARNLVRRSPGVAIGAAAAVGFVLVRLIKSGMDEGAGGSGGTRGGGGKDVEFQPDTQLAISPESGASAAGVGA